MSEYQYYEFLAIDRPLDEAQLAEVGSLSSRARITATSFVNEYHWGDFRGDPDRMMQRYYDAHLYFANWGTRRVMLRLPRTVLAPEVVEEYCAEEGVTATVTGEFIVLDVISEDDSGMSDVDGVESLANIAGVRAELATGDLRPLYLAWLASLGTTDQAATSDADRDLEPPVPPGLATLSASQQALATFLRVDRDLLAIAAAASAKRSDAPVDGGLFASWLAHLPTAEKDEALLRVVDGETLGVRAELLRRFRDEHVPTRSSPARRTVAELLEGAAGSPTD